MMDFLKWLPDFHYISGVLAVVLENGESSILPCIWIKVESCNRFGGIWLQYVEVLNIRMPCAQTFSFPYVHAKQLLTQRKQASQNSWQREVFSYLFLNDTELNKQTNKQIHKNLC
jgi:hypothetical protein